MKWAGTLANELGILVSNKTMEVKTDSDAARSFVNRRGLGKMRHIEVRNLWLQEEVRLNRIRVSRIKGEDNPADLMKFLKKDEVKKRLMGSSIEWKEQ